MNESFGTGVMRQIRFPEQCHLFVTFAWFLIVEETLFIGCFDSPLREK